MALTKLSRTEKVKKGNNVSYWKFADCWALRMAAFQFTVMCTRPANSLMTRQSTKVPTKKLPFAFHVALMAIIFTGSASVCDSVLNGNQVGSGCATVLS